MLISPCPVFSGTKVAQITSPFGYREINGKQDYHFGIDLIYPDYYTVSIVPITYGIVKKISYDSSRGKYIVIRHNSTIESHYYHLENIYTLENQLVSPDTVIATMGNTGNSSGYHLHFQINENNTPISPYNYLTKTKTINSDYGSSWSFQAVQWAVHNELLLGDENHNLNLKNPITREELITILYRYNERMKSLAKD